MNNTQGLLQTILIWAIPILYAVTLHEVAHGWVASKLGDKTALIMGRLSLNPLKHIDLVGTIIVPILFLLVGGFIFGWAKPVPVDYRNLRHPSRDMALVALAGPTANLLMALIWALFAKFMLVTSGQMFSTKALVLMGEAGISINLMLMLLNLIPVPPLDGSRLVTAILPPSIGLKFESIAPFGFIILVLLIMSGVLLYIIQIPYQFLESGFYRLFSL